MSLFNRKTNTENQIRKSMLQVALVSFGVVMLAIGTITYVITTRSAKESKDKVVHLLRMNNQQQVYNLSLYMGKVEDTAALLFSDDAYCDYDATAEGQDEFDKIQQETAIEKRLQDLAVMQNFSDFGIVYADDSTLGYVSNTTVKLFPNGGLFDYLVSHIEDETTGSGWFFDYDKCYDRIYYVQKLNEHAILTAAFYSRELSATFSKLQDLEEISTYLMDQSNIVLYANETSEVGKHASELLPELEDDYGDYQLITNDTVMISNLCENNWRVVCVVPSSVLFSEEQQFLRYSLLITSIMIFVILLIGALLFVQVAKRQTNVLTDIRKKADYDQLTQLFNKQCFRELVSAALTEPLPDAFHVLMMIDLDNFKKINDTYGHHEGDQLLRATADVFRSVFSEDAMLGRVGGDEFSIYTEYSGMDEPAVTSAIETKIEDLFQAFEDAFHDQYENCGMSLSAGGYLIRATDACTYEDAYQRADRAMYVSKRNGKHQFNWYER